MTERTRIEKEWCKRLRDLREETGISQAVMAREMSKLLGAPWRQSRVWKLLWGEMPITVAVFDAALRSLGVTLEDFVLQGRAGTGEFLDDGERQLIHLYRRTQTTDLALRTALRFVEHHAEMSEKRGRGGAKGKHSYAETA